MTVKSIVVTHEGGMRFTAENALGRTLVMDDTEGGGGPSPIDTLLASLGGCTGMDVIAILVKKRQTISRYTVETTAIQRDDAYPKVFTRMDVTHVVEGPGVDTTAVRRAIELSALKYCPVSAMLCAGTVEVHHRFRVVRPDGGVEEGEVVVRGPGAAPLAEAAPTA
jgi:putative redox protein